MADPTDQELAGQKQARADGYQRIVDSASAKRLIVAGPGTGKTYIFGRAFAKVGNAGLALTFIRALEDELRARLPESVRVSTFHAYCKHLLHKFHGSDPFMYPPLIELVASDMAIRGRPESREDIDEAFHKLDDSKALLTESIERADYYGAVSYNDIVYRVLRFLQAEPRHIETFPLIVVDEYQDFNRLETEFIGVLATKNYVLIAGDDDQALYTLKHASPDFLRALAADRSYERFELPFSSRCTGVVVGAVNDVVGEAKRRGLLKGRIAKPFECYMPDKLSESKAHPRIIAAKCSVEMKRAAYMSRYVVEQISKIPQADVDQSNADGYPTVLVIAPRPFLESTFEFVLESYKHAELKASKRDQVEPLEGYRRLLADPRSRLGWRILIHCFPFADSDVVLGRAIGSSEELADLIPPEYKLEHLAIAALLRKVVERASIDRSEQERLEQAVERDIAAIREVAAPEPKAEPAPAPGTTQAPSGPSIVCTTLVGAKGLSAGHVFIVGLMNGHFPRDPDNIRDDEVCSLIVALSRTRKECHLVWCGLFAGQRKRPSEFLKWIHQDAELRTIDKAYWEKA